MITRPSASATTTEALEILRRGGVVAHATETCYGLACDLTNTNAVVKLFAIKKRPIGQPVSALFMSMDDAKRYVEWNAEADVLAAKYLPGPLTIILPLRPDAPHHLYPMPTSFERSAISYEQKEKPLKAQSSRLIATLGLRISNHPLAQELVQRFGSPISTTSANIHGEPNLYDAHAIMERFASEEHQPDLIIDSGPLPKVPPSTVIDLTRNGKRLREGSLK